MSIPESHLAQEAIAALVDGELTAGPAARAARHLTGCMQCRMAVQAQREAKAALHGSQEVAVPGDLMSRLCAIPFTADVPGAGRGPMSLGGDRLTVQGGAGAWEVDLSPQDRPSRPDHARWLRRGLVGTLAGLGAGVTALALNLPADVPAAPGTVADSAVREHTEVVPPVVRTLDVGTTAPLDGQGGTP